MNEPANAPHSGRAPSGQAPSTRILNRQVARYHVPLRRADAIRSNRNIALWNSYLPTACVRTMVRLGWDYST